MTIHYVGYIYRTIRWHILVTF